MIFLHYLITEIDSFPLSVANNFCDKPLPKYLDSKTVLIYRPQMYGVVADSHHFEEEPDPEPH